MWLGEDWGLIFRHNYLNASAVLQVLIYFFFKFPAFSRYLYIFGYLIKTYDSAVKRYVLINILLFVFTFSIIYVNALNKCLFAYERQADTWKSVTFLVFFQDLKDSDSSLTINGMEKKRRKARVFWDSHVISNWYSEGKKIVWRLGSWKQQRRKQRLCKDCDIAWHRVILHVCHGDNLTGMMAGGMSAIFSWAHWGRSSVRRNKTESQVRL